MPAAYFPSVEPGLFERAVNRCVEPGRPCAAETMARDTRMDAAATAEHGAHPMDMPAAGAGMPTAESKPTAALFKAAQDKGSGPNVAAPVRPSTPGQPATNN